MVSCHLSTVKMGADGSAQAVLEMKMTSPTLSNISLATVKTEMTTAYALTNAGLNQNSLVGLNGVDMALSCKSSCHMSKELFYF
ncbi:unnamed protein product [Protopolystoma xenopodis]|uniref:Uncharacterized protein n=1 Tax=Protopolystoma xenopodis TaxID=117903 RepID=A0A448XKJ6_9PLAT|nr:unnamed protein product [Protopolystoma xenopodis]